MSDVTPTSSMSALKSGITRLFTRSTAYSAEVADLVKAVKANHPKADLSIIEELLLQQTRPTLVNSANRVSLTSRIHSPLRASLPILESDLPLSQPHCCTTPSKTPNTT